MRTFDLTVSTPDGDRLREEVRCLSLRGTEGELAIMAGHVPFVTAVKSGVCKIELADETVIHGRTDGGILTVSQEGVTLLAGQFSTEETK